jgi:hypothetical protein
MKLCRHKEHWRHHSTEGLYKEAAFVGLALIPMWWGISLFTTGAKINKDYKPFIDIALAGAAFHLVSEESGLNAWYLKHSYAARKHFSQEYSNDGDPSVLSLDWLRDSRVMGSS